MKTAADVLDETLGVLDPVEQELKGANTKVIVKRPSDKLEDVDADYKYQRENFYNLVERGQDAIEGILEIAKESEHPRTYEVAGNLIKQVAEVTEKLGDLQEKMKRLKEVPNSAPKNVTNALFVGSTAELQKMLKGKTDGHGNANSTTD
tara:strand:- start:746 stop:1192 length:447 start_codon:yes stop_codon:yes gene_type:complete